MSSIKTPFSYNTGINYESWPMGRQSMDIPTNLNAVTQHFSLLKTFHCAAVGTTKIGMDPTQEKVINFITGFSGQPLELIMGTNNSALAQGGFGTPWSAGLMTSSDYTDKWVDMVIRTFGNLSEGEAINDKAKANTLKHLKCICLGNEVDANGPPENTEPANFEKYYEEWIPNAFDNLKASLKAAELDSIPVTTIIANYPLGDNPSINKVARTTVAHVKANWSPDWNGGNSFLFFNQYTPDWGKSTDFNAVITYFNNVANKLGGAPQVFVGETGYSKEFDTTGHPNEATVINAMFDWLSGQFNNGGITTPLCVFMAFDHPAKPEGQREMGLFEYQASTASVKAGIKIPVWVNQPLAK